jgi:hypothetical protein
VPILVHQNMRTWNVLSPSKGYRNDAYRGVPMQAPPGWNGPWPPGWPNPAPAAGSYGFRYVRTVLSAGQHVYVAGLTEVTRLAPATAFEPILSELFDPPGGPLPQLFCVNAGTTALGHQEYAVIGVHADAAVVGLGFIAFDKVFSNTGLAPRRTMAPNLTPHNANPTYPWGWNPDVGPVDYRGISFIQFSMYGGPVMAVGFLHNMYVNREVMTLVMEALGRAVHAMMVPAAQHAYLGGDFNAAGRGYTRPDAFVYATGINLALGPPQGRTFPGGGPNGATSWQGSFPIDYWISDRAPAQGLIPMINTGTLDGAANTTHPMSDHVASLLQIP